MAETLIDCIVFVATDVESWEYLLLRTNVERYAKWNMANQSFDTRYEKIQYGDKKYFALMLERLKLVKQLLLLNISVALIEADQVLFKNPFKSINAFEATGKHDFITKDDSKLQNERMPCFGFMFIRANTRTIHILTLLVEAMQTNPRNEQVIMHDLMQHKSLAIRFLPPSHFRNGWFLLQQEDNNKPCDGYVMVHINWVVGKNRKIEVLKKNKWYLTSLTEWPDQPAILLD